MPQLRVVHVVDIVAGGEPIPAGSYRPVPIRRQGIDIGSRVINDNPRTKTWQAYIADVARNRIMDTFGPSWEPWAGPVEVSAVFTFARPKSHYGSGAKRYAVRRGAPSSKTTKPDLSKLLRAIEDALSGVIYRDDAQIVSERIAKVFVPETGATVGPGCVIVCELCQDINEKGR